MEKHSENSSSWKDIVVTQESVHEFLESIDIDAICDWIDHMGHLE